MQRRGHRGTATLPLHGGKAPAWLFRRMTELAGLLSVAITEEYGPAELLRRLSDPHWFQALGCVLGFDWHSSGVTTTVCGALKEAHKKYGADMGIIVCGGKGATSRKTPEEIARHCETTGDDGDRLAYASRLSAKVDNTAVQDGYQLYHHVFLFVPGGPWSVVQQGMNGEDKLARRYHWLSTDLDDFLSDPHEAVVTAFRPQQKTLNLAASEGADNRQAAAELAREHPEKLFREIEPLLPEHLPLFDLQLPRRHTLTAADINPRQLKKVLLSTYESQPAEFEQLLAMPGVGPKTVRSLALVAEVIHNAPASHRDPAAYSFAHGGKDSHPFPVDRPLYDETIEFMRAAVGRARLDSNKKAEALKGLAKFADDSGA